jgi:ATP-binding cassette, subfamily B, multidrug efflux pump
LVQKAAISDLPVTLAGQFKRHVPAYAFGALALGAFQLAMNRIDWLSRAAVDGIFSAAPETAYGPAGLMLVLAIVAFVARVTSRWFIFNAGRDAEYELRALMLDRLHRLGTAFYRTMSAGEIMSRATNDLVQVRLLLGFGVLNIINVVFAFTSALQVMTHISWRLALACLANLPILIFVSRTIGKSFYARTRANQETLGRMSEVLQANLAGVRVVRSFALDAHELRRFETANRQYLEASLAFARLRGSMGPIMGAAGAVSLLVFFWYGGSLLLRGPELGGLSKGEFFAFWLALGRMTWPMLALGFALAIIQRGRAGYARLKEIFDATPEIVDGVLPAPSDVRGDLAVSGLTFSYGKRVVLDDVTFAVKKGRSLAVVGRTGSGKSTLAMLLARLLPTPRGTVRIDGHDVCDLPLTSVRGVIGYAQQDAFLFSTTVHRNIGFTLEDPDTEASGEIIRSAAREAQVFEEAMGLPEQFDTVVGERGVQLSGGQKQRIALARALSWGPKILVLDDPLSAVDAKTESQILGAIERQAARRSVVLITHRVAAARRCDEIIVLDNGRVTERGTHDELVGAGGLYAAFAEEQQMAHELEEIDAVPESLPQGAE